MGFNVVIWSIVGVGAVSLLWQGTQLPWVRRLFHAQPFGKASWASWWQLRRAGLTSKRDGGLFLGRSRGRDLYHHGEGHLLTIGGTGGGKSVGLVVPALLNLENGSVVVTDPSGELAAMTKRHRESVGRVVLLNPFASAFTADTGLDFEDTGFNPLSVLDPALPTFKADCDALARLLMVTDRRESGSYWNDEGAEFLSLIIAATILYEDSALHELAFIYQAVRDNPSAMEQRLIWITDERHPALMHEAERFLGIVTEAPQQWQGIVSKAALATKRYAPSTPLGEHTKKNGFDALDLKRENISVYLLVPSAQLPTALPWMNLLMGVFGMAIGRPAPARSVTFLIDEAPSLGYLPDLIPFMAQYRKAGLRVWLFTQTAAQLAAAELYGETGFRTIAGLASVKQFFAIREKDTAQRVSDMAGQRTARNLTDGKGGVSVGDVGVPLVRPEVVRGLKEWQQIIIVDRLVMPIRARLVPFFRRRAWRELTDPNPYRA